MHNVQVSTEYTGGGDPQRSIELLWGARERPTRGPKPRLSVTVIVGEAIRLADVEGLEALSMRRVADKLGVAPMSLYTYVPSKSELLDLMTDTVRGELPTSDTPTGGWRSKLELVAKANWELYHRHPWMLHVMTRRPPLGPHTMAKYEHELAAVDQIGLTDLEMDSVVSLIADYVEGAARNAIEAIQVEQRTGRTDRQWWEASAPVLEKLVDPNDYPLGGRIGTAVGEQFGAAAQDSERNFDFGLARILDGIGALVSSRA